MTATLLLAETNKQTNKQTNKNRGKKICVSSQKFIKFAPQIHWGAAVRCYSKISLILNTLNQEVFFLLICIFIYIYIYILYIYKYRYIYFCKGATASYVKITELNNSTGGSQAVCHISRGGVALDCQVFVLYLPFLSHASVSLLLSVCV